MSSSSDDDVQLSKVKQQRLPVRRRSRKPVDETTKVTASPRRPTRTVTKQANRIHKTLSHNRQRPTTNNQQHDADSSDPDGDVDESPMPMHNKTVRRSSDRSDDEPNTIRTKQVVVSTPVKNRYKIKRNHGTFTKALNNKKSSVTEGGRPKRQRITVKSDNESLATESDDETLSDVEQSKKDIKKGIKKYFSVKEDHKCPHCFKVIGSSFGLKYHIDKFVCRKDQAPSGEEKQTKTGEEVKHNIGEERKRKTGEGRKRKAAKQGPKKRAHVKVEDRTCPNCHRVFTSLLGFTYHVKHQVCIKAGDAKREIVPCETLEPGSRFITQFGIVEVVKDDRAIPSATLPKDIKSLQKRFHSHKDRLERQQKRIQANFTLQSRLRRHRLHFLYQTKDWSAQLMHRAYFGGQKGPALQKGEESLKWVHDPSFPPESFPDRIVECKLIPDERTKVVGEDDENKVLSNNSPSGSLYASNLFLRRRLLVKPYVANISFYLCTICGAEYQSKDGFVYHVRSEICTRKQQSRRESAQEFSNGIEDRVTRALRTNRYADKKRRRMQSVAVYPDIWRSLEFKRPYYVKPLEAIDLDGDDDDENKNTDDEDEVVKRPEDTLEALRLLLRREKDQLLGAVYPSVWKSLGFAAYTKASKRKKQSAESARVQPRRTRKSTRGDDTSIADEFSTKVYLPPLPIIDMQVLVDEADTGRYPSVRRFLGVHDSECRVCKESNGTVHKCTFCRRVVHMVCARTKVGLQDPEPDDDFMCHSCIKYILARRRRAEKRRFQKQEYALLKAAGRRATEADAVEKRNAEEEQRNAEEKAAEMQFESEYHRVAYLGQELSEMMELLADARTRMNQLAESSRANDIRRSLLL